MTEKLIPAIVLSLLPFAAPARAAVLQNTQPAEFGSGELIEDATASLTRLSGAIETSFQTKELPAGAYTFWWIIFNNPEFCIDGCDAQDFANEAVVASGLWGTGGVVGDDGMGNFNARLAVDELPSGDDQVMFGPGLKDAFAAEVHTVLRWHGPASDNPQELEEQITTLNGGCATSENPDLFPCRNVQFAVFPAQSVPESSSILGLVALGTLGIGLILKRHSKRL